MGRFSFDRLLRDLHSHCGSRADSPMVIATTELLELHDFLLHIARVLVDYTPDDLEHMNNFSVYFLTSYKSAS